MNKVQTQIEVLDHQRARWLLVNLIGFFIWDGSRIIQHYLLADSSEVVFTGFILLGGLIWIVSLVRILQIGKAMKRDKQVFQILNDELITINRFKAWRVALVAVVLTQVAIVFVALFVSELSGIFAAEVSIFVAVVSSIGGFLYFNNDNANA